MFQGNQTTETGSQPLLFCLCFAAKAIACREFFRSRCGMFRPRRLLAACLPPRRDLDWAYLVVAANRPLFTQLRSFVTAACGKSSKGHGAHLEVDYRDLRGVSSRLPARNSP